MFREEYEPRAAVNALDPTRSSARTNALDRVSTEFAKSWSARFSKRSDLAALSRRRPPADCQRRHRSRLFVLGDDEPRSRRWRDVRRRWWRRAPGVQRRAALRRRQSRRRARSSDAARTLPMMAPRRVVMVLQRGKMLAPKKGRGAASPRTTKRAPAISSRFSTTCRTRRPPRRWSSCSRLPTVRPTRSRSRRICASRRRWRRRARWCCAPASMGARILSRWVVERAKAAGLEIDRQAVTKLLSSRADDPGRLRADVEKLLLFAAGAGRSPWTMLQQWPARLCIMATTGRWSRQLEAGNPAAGTSRAPSRARQRGRPVRFSGRLDTPSERRRREAGFRPGACRRPSRRCSGRMWP